MLLFTGNIQVRMRNIGTGAWASKAMKIRKNKRNWRKWMWWTESTSWKIVSSSNITWCEKEEKCSVHPQHMLRIHNMHLLRMKFQTTNVHYAFLYSLFCTIVTICDGRVSNICCFQRDEKTSHISFSSHRKTTHVPPIHSVWLDSIRIVSVPFCVYGNLWRYGIKWNRRASTSSKKDDCVWVCAKFQQPLQYLL